MLAFLRDHNDSQSVIDIFKRLYFELRPDRFAHFLKSALQITALNFQVPKRSNTTVREICAPTFFIVIRVLPIHRRISVSWMDHINSYSWESIGINALMMCFLFCMGRRSRIFLGATKLLPRT